MRTAAHRVGVFALLLVAVALGGCVPDAGPSRSPVASSSTSTPLFASDDEALAAATDAYKAYLAMSDLIASEGGKNPERMDSVATNGALDAALLGFEELLAKGLRIEGSTVLSSSKLQRIDREARRTTIYVCEDVSAINLLDSGGNSIVSPTRVDVTPFEVSVEFRENRNLVDERKVWSGENFCI